jgi:hypothetical protein
MVFDSLSILSRVEERGQTKLRGDGYRLDLVKTTLIGSFGSSLPFHSQC